MLGLLLLTAITTFHPANPTVGDPITIDFASPTVVDPSPDFEVVSHAANRIVIRTFVPHTVALTGRAADGPISVMIPIHSVLKPDDKLEPAPLKPPKPEAWPRLPFVAVVVVALAAIAAWTAVVLLAKRRAPKPIVIVVPVDTFRARVLTLRRGVVPSRWAALADAVRQYLAAVRADLGAELTTSELLTQIGDDEVVSRRRYDAVDDVAHILRQGDLEKFSPWGAAPANFDEALNRALEIPRWADPPPAPPADQEVAA